MIKSEREGRSAEWMGRDQPKIFNVFNIFSVPGTVSYDRDIIIVFKKKDIVPDPMMFTI